MLPQQAYAAEVRARLRNPPNAKPDSGFDLRRFRNELAAAEQRKLAAEKQARFEAACLAYFNWQWDAGIRTEKELLVRRPSPIDPTLAQIMATVARFYTIPIPALKSSRKTAREVRARQVVFWLARELTCRSLPEIGRMIGGRDHTTILYGARKIERLSASDPVLKSDLSKLLSALRPHNPEIDNAEDITRTGC